MRTWLVLAAIMAVLASSPAPAQETDMLTESTGLKWGPLRLSGALNLGIYYDSNPTYARSGEEKEVYALRAEPILDLILKGNGWGADARGWLIYNWPLNERDTAYGDTVDKLYYGETLNFHADSPQGMRFTLTEFYELQNRQNNVVGVDAGGGTYNASWGDRHSFLLGSSLIRPLGEKTGISVGASFQDLFYDNAALYDWKSYAGSLGLTRRLTEKTDAVFAFDATAQESEGSAQSQQYRFSVGAGSRATAKISYRTTVGAMMYDYNDGDEQKWNWTYDVSGAWRATSRLSLTLSGTANYQPSEVDKNNYALVQTLAGGASYQATRRLTASLNGVYRRESYGRETADPDTGSLRERLDNQFSLYGRVNYRLQRHANVFMDVQYSRNDSNINAWDYDRLFVEAGINLRY